MNSSPSWELVFLPSRKVTLGFHFQDPESHRRFRGKAVTGYYLCGRGINLAARCKMNLRRVREWGWKVENRTFVTRLMLQSRRKATGTEASDETAEMTAGADGWNKEGATGGDSGFLSTARGRGSREAGLSRENEELSFARAHLKGKEYMCTCYWKVRQTNCRQAETLEK